MTDAFVIAEKKMPIAIAANVLVFKAHVRIRTYPLSPRLIQVGDLLISKEAVREGENSSQLVFNGDWHMEAGSRLVPGLVGLQRCISSPSERDGEVYYIPANYLLNIRARY